MFSGEFVEADPRRLRSSGIAASCFIVTVGAILGIIARRAVSGVWSAICSKGRLGHGHGSCMGLRSRGLNSVNKAATLRPASSGARLKCGE